MSDKLKKLGRPTIFSEELATRICELVATHPCGLKKLCREHDWMPDQTTINDWRLKNLSFSRQYAQAKLNQADLFAEDCIDIADDVSNDTIVKETKDGDEYEVANNEWINRSRLRVDTRKWMAAKLLPELYGEQKKIENLEKENDKLKEEMLQLRAKLDAQNKKDY